MLKWKNQSTLHLLDDNINLPYQEACIFCGACFNLQDMNFINNKYVCYLCNYVYNLENVYSKIYNQIELYISEVSQTTIIKKTIEYIIKHNEIPEPDSIDPHIMKVNISPLELIIMKNDNKLHNLEFFNKLKIFFSPNFNKWALRRYIKHKESFEDDFVLESDEVPIANNEFQEFKINITQTDLYDNFVDNYEKNMKEMDHIVLRDNLWNQKIESEYYFLIDSSFKTT